MWGSSEIAFSYFICICIWICICICICNTSKYICTKIYTKLLCTADHEVVVWGALEIAARLCSDCAHDGREPSHLRLCRLYFRIFVRIADQICTLYPYVFNSTSLCSWRARGAFTLAFVLIVLSYFCAHLWSDLYRVFLCIFHQDCAHDGQEPSHLHLCTLYFRISAHHWLDFYTVFVSI